MTRTSVSSRLLGLFDTFGSALAAANATRQHRQPHASDLKRLGIDPDQFREINRF